MTITKTILFILIMGLVAACGDAESSGDESTDLESQTLESWTLQVTPQTGPLEAGEELFLLDLRDDSGPIEPEHFEVEAWMPMHGHGTMKPTEVERIDVGVYEARVIFSMPGAWQLQIDTDERYYEFDMEVTP